MLIDEEDLAIVIGTLGLAKAFHREVIAEGVETVKHAEKLLELGCDLAQGYGRCTTYASKFLPDYP